MKATNYIVVFGWMIKDLKLSGYDLLLYGMIYGYSQDGESWMKCSMRYLSSTLNASKTTIQKSLKKLLERDLIYRENIIIENVTHYKYRVNFDAIGGVPKSGTPVPKSGTPVPKSGTPVPKSGTPCTKKWYGGGSESGTGGVPESGTNNTINSNTKSNTKDNIISSTIVEEPKPKKPKKKISDETSKFHGECFEIYQNIYSEYLGEKLCWSKVYASATIRIISKIKSKMGEDAKNNELVKQNFDVFLRAIMKYGDEWIKGHFQPTTVDSQFDSIYLKLKNNGRKQINIGGADLSAEYINNLTKDVLS